MIVKELIRQLQNVDQNAIVYILSNSSGYMMEIDRVNLANDGATGKGRVIIKEK